MPEPVVKQAEMSVETSTTMITGAFRDAVSSLFKGAEKASQLAKILQSNNEHSAELRAVRSVTPMVAPSNRHAGLGQLDKSTAVGLDRSSELAYAKNHAIEELIKNPQLTEAQKITKGNEIINAQGIEELQQLTQQEKQAQTSSLRMGAKGG